MGTEVVSLSPVELHGSQGSSSNRRSTPSASPSCRARPTPCTLTRKWVPSSGAQVEYLYVPFVYGAGYKRMVHSDGLFMAGVYFVEVGTNLANFTGTHFVTRRTPQTV